MEKKESTNNLIFVKNWVSFYFHLMSQTSAFFTQDQGGLLQFLKLPSKPVNPVSLKIG